mgnify:CR=1 FL=1
MGKILDVRTPSPGRLSVLEKAMRNFAERKSEFVIKPETGQEFDSLPEACTIYAIYLRHGHVLSVYILYLCYLIILNHYFFGGHFVLHVLQLQDVWCVVC